MPRTNHTTRQPRWPRIVVLSVTSWLVPLCVELPQAVGVFDIQLVRFSESHHPNIENYTEEFESHPDNPLFFEDPGAAQLEPIMEYAEEQWERIFQPNDHEIEITWFWDNDLDQITMDDDGNLVIPSTSAISGDYVDQDDDGRIDFAVIRFNPNRTLWWFDPTPDNDSEFDMGQQLYRDIPTTSVQNPAWRFPQDPMPGQPPDLFETAYFGNALMGGDADGKRDTVTVAMHEMGHAIGGILVGQLGQEAADFDFDLDPDKVGGSQVVAYARGHPNNADPDEATEGLKIHLAGFQALMGRNLNNRRKRPSAVDVLMLSLGSGLDEVVLDRTDFLVGNDWSVDGNWEGDRVPSPHVDAYIRHGGLVSLSENDTVTNLVVDGGSHLALNDQSDLSVFEDVRVGGQPGTTSLISINTNSELDAESTTISDDGRIFLSDSTSLLQVEDIVIENDGELRGEGIVDINSVSGILSSHGVIRASAGELRITSSNTNALELGGEIFAVDGDIRFQTGTSTAMTADVTIDGGRTVTFEQSATIGSGGLIELAGNSGNSAVVDGSILTFQSDFPIALPAVIRANGLGTVQNSLILLPGGVIETIAGDPDSEIRLIGTTFFEGGRVRGSGFARQNGEAFFNADTEININTYDMDGQVGDTTLNIEPGVTVRIDSPNIDTAADNAFDGMMNIDGGTLHMEHDWTLDGTLNLTQDGTVARLVGPGRLNVSTDGTINVSGAGRIDSPITLVGTLSVGSVVDVNSDTIIDSSAELETNGPNDAINLYGSTVIGGGTYSGGGLLRFQGDIQVIGDTSIGMGQSDLDGTNLGGSLNIAQGVTLSVASTTIDPADDDYDDTMNLRGTFSTIVPFELAGTVNMIQEGRGFTPQINGLTGFTIHASGQVNTDGDAEINRDTTVQGGLHVGQGITRINAATILFESAADVTVAEGGTLELNGPTTYEGGSHMGLGLIQLNGMTNINDDTTIDTASVDLDGAAENTVLNLNDSRLSLNVELVDTASIQYNGLANVVGENARLAINLNGPFNAWRLMSGGQLNFSNPAQNAPTVVMLSGSPLSAEGVINAVGPLILAADVEVKNLLNVNTAQSHVHFGGPSRSTIHANRTATVVGLGQITVDNGTILNLEDQSQVAVDTTNRGRLEIGFEASEVSIDYTVPATATIRGFFAQTLTGELAVDLRGTVQATRYDWLQVLGMARLSGTVEATFIDDFVPALGTIFTILTATDGRDGEFDNVEAIDENDVLGFVLTDLYTATEAMLRVDDVFLIGDYNDDGTVNAADYVVYRKNEGTSNVLPNDTIGGVIGAAHYDQWLAHFGNTFPKSAASQGATIPEPATLVLVLMAAMQLLGFSKRRDWDEEEEANRRQPCRSQVLLGL